MKKIQLAITPAVIEHATKYGAIYDKENGWYCFEPAPFELEDFIVITAKLTKSYDDKYTQCQICGGQMQLKSTRNGGEL